MGFHSLRFVQFRNLEDGEIFLPPNIKNIFLVGENGHGKTNFLESLYILCYGTSFRTKNEKLLPKKGFNSFSLLGKYQLDQEDLEIFQKWYPEKKEFFVNQQAVKDRRALIQNIPCLAFVHDDFLFVQGPPEKQRLFFDQTLSLFDKEFFSDLLNYKKVLKIRNFLLKSSENTSLDIYEEQLVNFGLKIIQKRQNLIESFNPDFQKTFKTISELPENLEIKYSPSWKSEKKEEILKNLKEKRDLDRQFGATISGPHRDRFKFVYEGKNFHETASTGQIRLVSLILRLNQGIFYQKMTGKKPVFLIDDVLLELDLKKRKVFLESFPEYEQAFFTFLPGEGLMNEKSKEGFLIQVKQGRFTNGA